jgi:hypothetical protein
MFAAKGGLQLIDGFLCRLLAHVRIRARTEALRDSAPIEILVGASETASAWRSVFTATKSTCAMPASIILCRVESGTADSDHANRGDAAAPSAARGAAQLEHGLEAASCSERPLPPTSLLHRSEAL